MEEEESEVTAMKQKKVDNKVSKKSHGQKIAFDNFIFVDNISSNCLLPPVSVGTVIMHVLWVEYKICQLK